MNVIFKICKYNVDSISITGLEYDNGEYESIEDYKDYISLNVVIPVNSQLDKLLNYKQYIVELHEDLYDYSIIKLNKDGLYEIIRCIIPKNNTQGKIWYDVLEEKFYNKDAEPVTIDYILENLEETDHEIQYTFVINQLQACYYNNATKYLNDYCSNKCNQIPQDTNLVWMGINILQYLLDLGRHFDAQALLEQLQECAGICKNVNVKSFNNACGCN